MSSINTNLSAITALQSLKTTQNAMNKNQNQISTGLRVGEASHNASYWSISTKMKSDNGALGAVKDSIKQSKAMIDTYTSAIDKSLKYLDTMKTKLTAGSNPGANLEAIQVELKSSIEGLKSAASSATFNGQNWLSGEAKSVKLVSSYDGESKKVNTLDIDTTKVQLFDNVANPTAGLLKAVANIDVANPPKAAGYTDFSLKLADLTVGDTIDLKVSDGVTTTTATKLTLAAVPASLQALANTINGATAAGEIGTLVKATVVDNKLRLTSIVPGKDVTANFGDVSTNTGDVALTAGVVGGSTTFAIDATKLSAGDEIRFNVGTAASGAGGTAYSFKVGAERSIDDLVASINGDSAINSAVEATKDTNGKLKLTAKANTNNVGGSFANVSNGVSTTTGQIAVADALKAVDNALNELRAGSAMLGANKALLETQEEFIGVLSDSLTAGVSAFIDADMNEVSTRNQALQTQQQLGVQALSMANQNSQMILKLFQ
ncbi:flagellin [Microvirga soli]|uniref:flagellin n=1 Tax=Microvirga soli TaxID=1854496 RepID=UPI00191ECD93|nr:flagellin [Microvirga soli]